MHLVDDRLALATLGGWRSAEWGNEVPLTPWLAHMRLTRALLSEPAGSLTEEAFEGAAALARQPPAEMLGVLDPRPHTTKAAELIASQPMPILWAQMIAPMVGRPGAIHVSRKNYVPKLDRTLEEEGIDVRIYTTADLKRSQ